VGRSRLETQAQMRLLTHWVSGIYSYTLEITLEFLIFIALCHVPPLVFPLCILCDSEEIVFCKGGGGSSLIVKHFSN
jgi:hypothetical protein